MGSYQGSVAGASLGRGGEVLRRGEKKQSRIKYWSFKTFPSLRHSSLKKGFIHRLSHPEYFAQRNVKFPFAKCETKKWEYS